MPVASSEPEHAGIWPDAWLLEAVESGVIDAPDFAEVQLQPASIDLTLGDVAHRLRCSFLPGKNDTVENQMRSVVIGPPIPLEDGAILERNRPYLIRLRERLNLPSACGRARTPRARPVGSTGSPA
jgi:dCTP deaminase